MTMFAPFVASEHRGTFWLPEAASTFAASHDGLFYLIYWLNVIFFAGIVGTMIYFVRKYRMRSENDRTSPIRGSHKIELLWSLGPSVFLVVIFAWGFVGFMDMIVPPDNAMNVRVMGQKWSWAFTYPNGGTTNELVVPVGEPVKLTMSSQDVLHSFYVPAFRVKRDVIPNRYTVLWFQSDVPGTYPVYCTEYCGTEHSTMLATVRVVSREEYDAFVGELGGCPDGSTLEECGETVFSRAGCTACHAVVADAPRGVGPNLHGILGSQRAFVAGAAVTADTDYILESIINPGVKIVEGYPNVMPPSYGQTLNEEQLTALIAYIESLQ
jgi:cytochrome c oxidase subunit 2